MSGSGDTQRTHDTVFVPSELWILWTPYVAPHGDHNQSSFSRTCHLDVSGLR